MDEASPPPWRRPSRTIVALTAIVVLAGVVDAVRAAQPGGSGEGSVPRNGQPIAVAGCSPTPAEPAPGDPGVVDASMIVTYSPADLPAAGAGAAAAPAAPGPAVRVAGVVESVGNGLALLVQPCQSVAAVVYGAMPDGSVVQATVAPGRLRVGSEEGGRVDLVDSASGARAVHHGAGGFTGFGGWYAVMTDPVPGVYPWHGAVTWRDGETVVGRGELDVRLVLGVPSR